MIFFSYPLYQQKGHTMKLHRKYLVSPPVPEGAIPQACDQLQGQGFYIEGVCFVAVIPVKRAIQVSPKPEMMPHYSIFISMDHEAFEKNPKKISLDLHL